MIHYGCSVCAMFGGYLVLCLLKRKNDNPKTSYIMGLLNIALAPVSFLRLGPFKEGHQINLVSCRISFDKISCSSQHYPSNVHVLGIHHDRSNQSYWLI